MPTSQHGGGSEDGLHGRISRHISIFGLFDFLLRLVLVSSINIKLEDMVHTLEVPLQISSIHYEKAKEDTESQQSGESRRLK